MLLQQLVILDEALIFKVIPNSLFRSFKSTYFSHNASRSFNEVFILSTPVISFIRAFIYKILRINYRQINYLIWMKKETRNTKWSPKSVPPVDVSKLSFLDLIELVLIGKRESKAPLLNLNKCHSEVVVPLFLVKEI